MDLGKAVMVMQTCWLLCSQNASSSLFCFARELALAIKFEVIHLYRLSYGLKVFVICDGPYHLPATVSQGGKKLERLISDHLVPPRNRELLLLFECDRVEHLSPS